MANVQAEVSRRRFLGMLGAAGTLAAFGGVTANPRRAATQEATPSAHHAASPVALARPVAMGNFSQVADLTHTASPTFPMYPGAEQMRIDQFLSVEQDGFYKNRLILDEHTGTHMDAPAHVAVDGTTADRLSVDRFVAPLAVIDISARAAQDPDTQLTPDDVLAWEQRHGPLPAGAFVAMTSGWDARVTDPARFINLDASGGQHYPGFHPDFATMLVDEREIVGIGVDTLSLDFGAATDFVTHKIVLPAGKFGLESVANLANVPPSGAMVIVGGPKHLNASGGPTRVLALF